MQMRKNTRSNLYFLIERDPVAIFGVLPFPGFMHMMTTESFME